MTQDALYTRLGCLWPKIMMSYVSKQDLFQVSTIIIGKKNSSSKAVPGNSHCYSPYCMFSQLRYQRCALKLLVHPNLIKYGPRAFGAGSSPANVSSPSRTAVKIPVTTSTSSFEGKVVCIAQSQIPCNQLSRSKPHVSGKLTLYREKSVTLDCSQLTSYLSFKGKLASTYSLFLFDLI